MEQGFAFSFYALLSCLCLRFLEAGIEGESYGWYLFAITVPGILAGVVTSQDSFRLPSFLGVLTATLFYVLSKQKLSLALFRSTKHRLTL